MGYGDYYRGPQGTIIGIHSLLRTRQQWMNRRLTTGPVTRVDGVWGFKV